MSIKLHLSRTIYAHHNINCDLISMQSTKWAKKLQKLDDIKKFSILKNGIGIECQKVQKQVTDERNIEANKRLKCY